MNRGHSADESRLKHSGKQLLIQEIIIIMGDARGMSGIVRNSLLSPPCGHLPHPPWVLFP